MKKQNKKNGTTLADEVAAAITMALHEKLNEFHDIESNVLTFKNSKTAS